MRNQPKLSRRRFFFMGGAAAGAAACASGSQPTVPSLSRLGYRSPNERLNVAAIGAGGKGAVDIEGCATENVVALCDPDFKTAAKTFEKFPEARRYKDFREMLDKERSLDAVTISTPDHTHAVAAMAAMRRGLHVYLQKPLTRTVYEARVLTDAARRYGVQTQMGNQGHSGEGIRQLCEMIWSGAIGHVREVHAWTNRPVWPQAIKDPLPAQTPPDHLDWDVWLGPAPMRPYNEGYAPFKWRGWFDWGCGALGDMACHILDGANWALQLGAPTSVECVEQQDKNDQTFPSKSIVKFEFPARGAMPPVTVTWYDGGLKPPRPAGIPEDCVLGNPGTGSNGSLFVGDKGFITTGEYCNDTRLVPDDRMRDYQLPPQLLTRSPGHYRDFIRACKGGGPACSNFDVAGPFTEWILLGVIALRAPGKLLWDGPSMRFSNSEAASALVKPVYRAGWAL